MNAIINWKKKTISILYCEKIIMKKESHIIFYRLGRKRNSFVGTASTFIALALPLLILQMNYFMYLHWMKF